MNIEKSNFLQLVQVKSNASAFNRFPYIELLMHI